MEWLERMEIPIENMFDINSFQSYLIQELGEFTEMQSEALWAAAQDKLLNEVEGITPILVTYPWGRELRYSIQGLPGLWGWESAQAVIAGERG